MQKCACSGWFDIPFLPRINELRFRVRFFGLWTIAALMIWLAGWMGSKSFSQLCARQIGLSAAPSIIKTLINYSSVHGRRCCILVLQAGRGKRIYKTVQIHIFLCWDILQNNYFLQLFLVVNIFYFLFCYIKRLNPHYTQYIITF